jgi:hypothetical protein
MSLGKNGMLAIFFLASSCISSQSPASSSTEFENKKKAVLELRSSEFEILQIREEGEAIRIDLALSPPALTESETRRRTLNALMEIQALIGGTDRLAVWSYKPNRQTIQGMAFYSPISEQYHFRTAGELR